MAYGKALFAWLLTLQFSLALADTGSGCTGIVAGTTAKLAGGTYGMQYTPFCGQPTEFTVTCPVTFIRNVPGSNYDFKLVARSGYFSNSYDQGVYPTFLTFQTFGHILNLTTTTVTYEGTDQTSNCNGNPKTIGNITLTCHLGSSNTLIASFYTNFGVRIDVTPQPQGYSYFYSVAVDFTSPQVRSAQGMLGTPGHGAQSPFILPDGSVGTDSVAVQDAWAIGNIGNYSSIGCTFAYTCDPGNDCWSSTQNNQASTGQNSICNDMNDRASSLGACWDVMPTDVIGMFYKDCIEKLAGVDTSDTRFCTNHVYPFMSTCRAYAIMKNTTVSFNSDPCPSGHQCPVNSHYDPQASVCFNNCVDPYASDHCASTRTEPRCECDYFSSVAHYVYDEGRCILLSQCRV